MIEEAKKFLIAATALAELLTRIATYEHAKNVAAAPPQPSATRPAALLPEQDGPDRRGWLTEEGGWRSPPRCPEPDDGCAAARS